MLTSQNILSNVGKSTTNIVAKTKVIAIDGPSGVGKSTTAKLVSEYLGWSYLDTGAMYRAVAIALKDSKINIDEYNKVQHLLNQIVIQQIDDREFLNGIDVSETIRLPEISTMASNISTNVDVRNALVCQQRNICRIGSWVVDGRDIGTVVFPNACCKIYLTANIEIRALRRLKQLNLPLTVLSEVICDLKKRDLSDSTRKIAPLRKADDAIELNSNNMTKIEVVNWIINKYKTQNTHW